MLRGEQNTGDRARRNRQKSRPTVAGAEHVRKPSACGLNAHCYWSLRQDGKDARSATKQLVGLSVADKNELLFQHGLNFNELPSWQRRGIGLHWQEYEKPSENQITGGTVVAKRRKIVHEYNLPMRDEYSEYVRSILASVS